MHDVARANLRQKILRIIRVPRVLHRIEVIEIAPELIEPVDAWQELVLVSQVVLAELPGGVAQLLQRGRDRRRLRRNADLGAGLADRGHPGTDRQLAGDEVGSSYNFV